VGPVILTWRVLARWSWLGLRTTPQTAFSYIWKATLIAGVPGIFATLLKNEFIGAGVACFAGVVWAFRRSLLVDLWNVHRVLDAAGAGDRHEVVRRAEVAIGRMLRFRDYVGARFTNAVAGLLLGIGGGAEAEKILASFPFERYIGVPFWFLLHTLAYYRIKLGMYAEAEASLERCGLDPPTPEFDREHRYFRALVDSATGKPKRALNRLEKDETPERNIVAAHAYVSLGRDEKAREAIERVRKEADGEQLLDQIAKGHGPAKALVMQVLGREPPSEEGDGPYR
jgi:hypothetical protein